MHSEPIGLRPGSSRHCGDGRASQGRWPGSPEMGLSKAFKHHGKASRAFVRWFDIAVLVLIAASMGLLVMDVATQIMTSTDGLIHRRWCGYHDVFTPWEFVRETAIDSAKVFAWVAVYLFIPRMFVRVSMIILTFGYLPAIHVFAVLF